MNGHMGNVQLFPSKVDQGEEAKACDLILETEMPLSLKENVSSSMMNDNNMNTQVCKLGSSNPPIPFLGKEGDKRIVD